MKRATCILHARLEQIMKGLYDKVNTSHYSNEDHDLPCSIREFLVKKREECAITKDVYDFTIEFLQRFPHDFYPDVDSYESVIILTTNACDFTISNQGWFQLTTRVEHTHYETVPSPEQLENIVDDMLADLQK